MHIQINPHSLLNLEHICEVLYKLHPSILNDLVEMERSLGPVLGYIDYNNLSLEEREFLANINEEDNKEEMVEYENRPVTVNSYRFDELRKYIQLDTDEYIPIKIYIEVEDPVIGRKVKELVRALEKTRAPEQFYLNKKEIDEDAYFAEGYGLKMNEEQKKMMDDLLDGKDVEVLEELLRKEKLYP